MPYLRIPTRSASSKMRFGAACVELAVVLPVLVLIVLGTIEACAMTHLTQSLYIAAYEGTRVSLIPKSSTANVRDAIDEILSSRRIKNPASISHQAILRLHQLEQPLRSPYLHR